MERSETRGQMSQGPSPGGATECQSRSFNTRHVLSTSPPHRDLDEGSLAFSVSKSQEDAQKGYIEGQAAHHKTEDFKSELLRTLRANNIAFDEKYVFDCSSHGRPIPPPLRGWTGLSTCPRVPLRSTRGYSLRPLRGQWVRTCPQPIPFVSRSSNGRRCENSARCPTRRRPPSSAQRPYPTMLLRRYPPPLRAVTIQMAAASSTDCPFTNGASASRIEPIAAVLIASG